MIVYEDRIVDISESIYKDLNRTLYSLRIPASAGVLPRLSADEWNSLNTTLSDSYDQVHRLTNKAVIQTGLRPPPPPPSFLFMFLFLEVKGNLVSYCAFFERE